MRPMLLTFLTAATLTSSVMAITDCTLELLHDAASHVSCGSQVEVSRCLSVLDEVDRLAFFKECLLAGGCSEEEAAASVQLAADTCSHFQVVGSPEDLKRRQNKDTTTSNNKATQGGKTTTAPKTTTTESTTTTTSETTSSTSTSTSTSQSTASSTATSSSSDSTSSSATATDTTTTTALQCLTTSQQSTTWCVTTTADGGAVNSACVPTTTPVVSCADGLICQTQPAGETTCMIRQDNLTTSGLVVTIIFGLIVAIFFTTCCTFCIKSRQKSQRQANQAKAVMVAGAGTRNTRDAEASKSYARVRAMSGGNADAEASDAHLPLMAAQGPIASSNSSMRDVSTDYNAVRPTAHRVPSSSYQDVVASRKPAGAVGMHAGPPDMGADYSDMGSGRGRPGR